ncbi:uncharacterized protein LOC142982853 [Anticarsia gemmatalis]|uniref:uncharacterized protein LOC142982853 n=1 Tax=Anticarsia gemmatalis TaxID=129554 RepID=UPI003F75E6A9
MVGLLFLLCLSIQSVISDRDLQNVPDEVQHLVKSCRIGDYVKNECIKCLCTSKNIFECVPLNCNKTRSEAEIDEVSPICLPNQLYVLDLVTCICTKEGKWPHKNCYETFQALPPNTVEKHKCDPNSYAVIECNVCWCGPDGEFIPSRCTKNTCDEQTRRAGDDTDTTVEKKSVYGNCETNTWYSMGACQFCYCVNKNKLVCNTGNPSPKNLQLGSYVLQICGETFLKEAMELKPDGEDEPTVSSTTQAPIEAVDDNDEVKQAYKEAAPVIEEASESESEQEEGVSEEKATVTTNAPVVVANASSLRTKGASDDESDSEESGDESKSESNEIPVDFGDRAETDNKNEASSDEGETIRNSSKSNTEPADVKFEDHKIKINVPTVLNKVFQMALRKSMVTLSKEKECEPGTTSTNGCNVCFCLKNGKKLCTSQNC